MLYIHLIICPGSAFGSQSPDRWKQYYCCTAMRLENLKLGMLSLFPFICNTEDMLHVPLKVDKNNIPTSVPLPKSLLCSFRAINELALEIDDAKLGRTFLQDSKNLMLDTGHGDKRIELDAAALNTG